MKEEQLTSLIEAKVEAALKPVLERAEMANRAALTLWTMLQTLKAELRELPAYRDHLEQKARQQQQDAQTRRDENRLAQEARHIDRLRAEGYVSLSGGKYAEAIKETCCLTRSGAIIGDYSGRLFEPGNKEEELTRRRDYHEERIRLFDRDYRNWRNAIAVGGSLPEWDERLYGCPLPECEWHERIEVLKLVNTRLKEEQQAHSEIVAQLAALPEVVERRQVKTQRVSDALPPGWLEKRYSRLAGQLAEPEPQPAGTD